jgi:hypothetical protein
LVSEIEPQLYIYTAEVWVVSLKRKVRLALLRDCRHPHRATVYTQVFGFIINLI